MTHRSLPCVLRIRSAFHLTVAGHDESDAVGLFTGVGGVHIYVLCRINRRSDNDRVEHDELARHMSHVSLAHIR